MFYIQPNLESDFFLIISWQIKEVNGNFQNAIQRGVVMQVKEAIIRLRDKTDQSEKIRSG